MVMDYKQLGQFKLHTDTDLLILGFSTRFCSTTLLKFTSLSIDNKLFQALYTKVMYRLPQQEKLFLLPKRKS